MAKLSWVALMAQLSELDEPTVDRLLQEEITVHKRPAIVQRLHQRACKLRAIRERKEIMKKMKA